MKRRVLITTSASYRDSGLRRIDAMTGRNYSDALVEVGLLPVMTASLAPELAPELLDGMDGVVFPGGGDLDPVLFDEPPHPGLGSVDPVRDAFELALYRAARARGLPILGICRGVQVMVVAEGGSVHQHLTEEGGFHQHDQRAENGELSHRVRLSAGSALARAFGADSVRVNSYHHQGPNRVPPSLRAVAVADDGLVEAVEARAGGFVLGVQWHPEMSFERHPRQLAPFAAFAEAVRDRAAQPVPGT